MGDLMTRQIDKIQIRHNSLIVYTQTEYDFNIRAATRFDLSSIKGENDTYSGQITYHARRRINHAIHKLLLASPPILIHNPITDRDEIFTINFITLTIPCISKIVDTKEGYNTLLAPFIRTMRRKYNLQSYIWKAEMQERGQLHYHLTTNTFINWVNIRNEWNYLLRRNNLMDEYIAENGNDNPNSTDVHKVYKIKDIASYLSKYISKDISKCNERFAKREPSIRYNNEIVYGCMISCSAIVLSDSNVFDSKIWDCSNDIKKSKLPNIELDIETKLHLKSLVYQSKMADISTEFCNILKPVDCSFASILPKNLFNEINEFIVQLKNIRYERQKD